MRTTPLLLTAWAGAATVAVGLGFFSVSLLDADPVSASSSTPSSSATTTAATTTPGSASTTPAASTAGGQQLTGQQVTEAGTVYGSCVDGLPQAASAPAAGWEVDDSSTSTDVEFKAGDRRIHVVVTCTPTGPAFAVVAGGDDDGVQTTPSPGSGSPATQTAGVTPDDHGSGGHGSDDTGPDDFGSGGHGSGGHGSDD